MIEKASQLDTKSLVGGITSDLPYVKVLLAKNFSTRISKALNFIEFSSNLLSHNIMERNDPDEFDESISVIENEVELLKVGIKGVNKVDKRKVDPEEQTLDI